MKTRVLIKRIVAVVLLTILVLLLLLFLLINSPLVSMALEHYLNGFTGHSAHVGSARLSLFPQITLVAKRLALQEEGSKDPFITLQHIALELDAFKLLDKAIHIPRLDVNGCVVLLTADPNSGDSLLPLSFLTQGSGNDDDDIIKEPSGEEFKKIIRKLILQGADGLILGCTEIPLLVGQEDVKVPLFDTTDIHSKAAVEFALA